MPPHPAPFRRAAPAAAAVLALLAGAAAAKPAVPARPPSIQPSADAGNAGQAAAALAAAQDRSARAAAAVDELKRELDPGHLTDPMPDSDRAFGLASLRSDYADAQRRAAGYRATLGDQHPTLLATEQLMDDLRAQLLDGTRKALASAERDAADARADMAAAERRLAAPATARSGGADAREAPADARAADITGSVAAPVRTAPRPASPLALPPAAAPAARPEAAAAVPAPPASRPLRSLLAAAAAAVLAALSAAWAALRLLRSRRPRGVSDPMRRIEPALAAPPAPGPARRPAAPDAVPVLQRVALSRAGDPSPGSPSAMAGLHATLRAAFGGDAAARMTVLMAPVAGLPEPDADAAALALALAAAAAGRRPLLMEARAAGRLRGALVSAGTAPMLVEAGDASRTLYRLGVAGAPVALLPSDLGEAELAVAADARPGTARLRGFDAFDTVILVGDDAAALAATSDLLLLAAPAGTAPSALAEAALPLRSAGRPCGGVLIEAASPAATEAAATEAPAAPAPLAIPLSRRRIAFEAPSAARAGLRGTIEPSRRRVGG